MSMCAFRPESLLILRWLRGQTNAYVKTGVRGKRGDNTTESIWNRVKDVEEDIEYIIKDIPKFIFLFSSHFTLDNLSFVCTLIFLRHTGTNIRTEVI